MKVSGKSLNSAAILLCRISSDKQAEGYSLDFQQKAGIKYAERMNMSLTKTWRFTESASSDDRKKWEAFLEYVRKGPEQHVLIPKVDRCLRNFNDLAIVADIPKLYGKVLHFFDDGLIFQKDSPAADLLRLGVQGVVASWYSVDLSQKVKRGMKEKASQGIWPHRAPCGYVNNTSTKRIDVDSVMSPWVIRIKELAATGRYSCEGIARMLSKENCPRRLTKSTIHYILRNPIYYGYVAYQEIYTKGIHEPLITKELHDAAIAGLERFDRPKYASHEFRFKGRIHCADCHCAVVFERKKGRYVYGHCTRRRPCDSKGNVREEEIERQVELILASLNIGPETTKKILGYLEETAPHAATANVSQLAIAKQSLGRIKSAQAKALDCLLKETITEADYTKKKREYAEQAAGLSEQIEKLEADSPANLLPLARATLELANSCESLYKTMNDEQKRELLDSVCSNFFLDGKKLIPEWRKPFQLLTEMAFYPNWRGQRDSNP